ncbi:hypothetical protein ACWDR0_10510 [Streptomyces sp. NPDC003691]
MTRDLVSESVLATTDDGRFRVRRIRDKNAPNPRHDAVAHVITIDTHLDQYPPVDPDGGPLAWAWERLKWNRWNGVDTFTRYVSIMHGGIVLESAPEKGPRSLWYMTGPEIFDLDRGLLSEAYIEAEMEEYEAWRAGDVWGFAVEERVDWTRDEDPDDSAGAWDMVDNSWGLYGGPYARAEARDALSAFAARRGGPA